MLYNMMLFQAKTEKDQGLSRFPGRDSCGAVKNLRFLNSPFFRFQKQTGSVGTAVPDMSRVSRCLLRSLFRQPLCDAQQYDAGDGQRDRPVLFERQFFLEEYPREHD